MLRALLVEDNLLFRGVLAEVLRTRFPGIAVDEAGDSEAALRHVNERSPDLAFVDISLPGQNGIVLVREIKAIAPNVYVIMLTGHDLPEYRKAAFQEGADWYIYKNANNTHDEIIAQVRQLQHAASHRHA
jgi:DNA-binding NarL/FixJ family response regulator